MTKKRRSDKCEECGSSAWSLRNSEDGGDIHKLCTPCVNRINQMIDNAEREAGEFLRAVGMMS